MTDSKRAVESCLRTGPPPPSQFVNLKDGGEGRVSWLRVDRGELRSHEHDLVDGGEPMPR